MSSVAVSGPLLAVEAPSPRRGPAWRRALFLLLFGVAVVTLWAGGHRALAGRLFARDESANQVAVDPPTAEKQALLQATHGTLAVTRVEGLRAEAINKALPFARAPIEAAVPFRLAAAGAAAEDGPRAQLCMSQAIYYEAGLEPIEGRRAVAQVVLNRLRHPGFPKNVCAVVYEGSSAPGCQFSFTCDGSLRRTPAPAAWAAANAIAREALAGKVDAAVGQATHYHAFYITPYWAQKLTKLVQIGAHIFYRWPGGWGLKQAFTGRYAGHEALGIPRYPDDASPGEIAGTFPQAPDERRTPNDIGGRLDVSKGWTVAIPDPKDTRGALARVTSSQAMVALAGNADMPGSLVKAATR